MDKPKTPTEIAVAEVASFVEATMAAATAGARARSALLACGVDLRPALIDPGVVGSLLHSMAVGPEIGDLAEMLFKVLAAAGVSNGAAWVAEVTAAADRAICNECACGACPACHAANEAVRLAQVIVKAAGQRGRS